MYASDPCMHQISVCIRSLYASDLCMHQIPVCIRSLYAADPCMHQTHVCIRPMYASDPCMHQTHVCIRSMYASDPCMHQTHVSVTIIQLILTILIIKITKGSVKDVPPKKKTIYLDLLHYFIKLSQYRFRRPCLYDDGKRYIPH